MSMVRMIVGGVDTHADSHVAAAVDANGGVLGIESFPADLAGFGALLGWLVSHGEVEMVGVEGTGSWGVGLSRFLHDHEISVVEVDRPNRQNRRKVGKSDATDAVSAARAALSGSASVTPKTRNGPVEQMRILMVARRSARSQRIEALNQLRHLVFCGPEEVRARFKDRPKTGLVTEVAKLRPRKGSDPVPVHNPDDDAWPCPPCPTPQRRDQGPRCNARRTRYQHRSVVGRALRGRNRYGSLVTRGCRRQPRPAPFGAVMGTPVWRFPNPNRIRQNRWPAQVEPGRRPASQRSPLPDRIDPHEQRSEDKDVCHSPT